MKKIKYPKTFAAAGAVALGTLVIVSSVGLGQEVDPVAEGARVYGAVCGSCHNARSPIERSDRDWVTIVNQMRVRANMTGEQVRFVLAFLQAANSDWPAAGSGAMAAEAGQPSTDPPSTDPAVIARGRELVATRACLGCHVIGKEGSQVGPSLNGLLDRRDPDYVRKKLADPTFDNATSMMPNLNLIRQEIEAMLAYLATLDGN
jgi:mono/diheme cytochrome c family protein